MSQVEKVQQCTLSRVPTIRDLTVDDYYKLFPVYEQRIHSQQQEQGKIATGNDLSDMWTSLAVTVFQMFSQTSHPFWKLFQQQDFELPTNAKGISEVPFLRKLTSSHSSMKSQLLTGCLLVGASEAYFIGNYTTDLENDVDQMIQELNVADIQISTEEVAKPKQRATVLSGMFQWNKSSKSKPEKMIHHSASTDQPDTSVCSIVRHGANMSLIGCLFSLNFPMTDAPLELLQMLLLFGVAKGELSPSNVRKWLKTLGSQLKNHLLRLGVDSSIDTLTALWRCIVSDMSDLLKSCKSDLEKSKRVNDEFSNMFILPVSSLTSSLEYVDACNKTTAGPVLDLVITISALTSGNAKYLLHGASDTELSHTSIAPLSTCTLINPKYDGKIIASLDLAKLLWQYANDFQLRLFSIDVMLSDLPKLTSHIKHHTDIGTSAPNIHWLMALWEFIEQCGEVDLRKHSTSTLTKYRVLLSLPIIPCVTSAGSFKIINHFDS
jgi:hypothetical protein